VRAVPRLCELYPGICLTTEEKARKNLKINSASSWSHYTHISRCTVNKTWNMQHSRPPGPFPDCRPRPFVPALHLPTPLDGTARTGLWITSRHWIRTQKRGTRTGPNGVCADRNTDSLCLSLSSWCSFVRIGRRGGVLPPLSHFCTPDGLNILTTEITTWSRDHLETLTVVHLVPITLRVTVADSCLTVFTRAPGWYLSQVRRISTSSQPNNTFKIDFNIIHLPQLLVG
jgi:hypothetical protein